MTDWMKQLYLLNEDQKYFLFYKGYLTSKMLDADASTPDWKEFYVHRFNWYLHNPETSKLIMLDLIHKTLDGCNIKGLYINLTDHDKELLFGLATTEEN